MEKKKVRFNETNVMHYMHVWSYASQAARKGKWEEMARDRSRFKNRIQRLESIIGPILARKLEQIKKEG